MSQTKDWEKIARGKSYSAKRLKLRLRKAARRARLFEGLADKQLDRLINRADEVASLKTSLLGWRALAAVFVIQNLWIWFSR